MKFLSPRSTLTAFAVVIIPSLFFRVISAEDTLVAIAEQTDPPTYLTIEVTLPSGISINDADVINAMIQNEENKATTETLPEGFIADQTDPTTAPIIEVETSPPEGISTNDEDIADVVDSLTQTEENKGTAEAVNKPHKSQIETKFRQEFQIENGKVFSRDQLKLLEMLYQGYTDYFSPLSPAEVEKTITSICTVHKQQLLFSSNDRPLEATLIVDFAMRYESTEYDVMSYPELFQRYVANDLDHLTDQMRFLGFDVKGASERGPMRIFVRTPTPSATPLASETLAPSSSPLPTKASSALKEDPNSVSTKDSVVIATTTDDADPMVWSVAAIVVFSIALFLTIVTLVVAISVFLTKQPLNCIDDDTEESNVTTPDHNSDEYWKQRCSIQPDDKTAAMDSVTEGHSSHYP